MFADDLILLAILLRDLQLLVDICQTEFTIIGMEFNAKKSACIRIGICHFLKVHPVILNAEPLPWNK